MSFSSGIIDAIVGKFNNRSMYESDEIFEKWLAKKEKDNEKPYRLIYPFSSLITVEKMRVDGMRYYILNRNNCKKTVFYYHGGAYISRPTIMHWRFIERLLLNSEVCVVFPIYPRLPKHKCDYCFEMCKKLYKRFLKTNEVDEIIFMGDSAGGGLALTMATHLKNKTKKPFKAIMLSPWLDVITLNKDISKIQPTDKMLSQKGLNMLGKLWCGGDEKNDIASPIYAGIHNVDMTIVIGTNDLLYPDTLLLKKRAEEEKQNIKYYEYKHMCHCFILMPTPEADDAFKKVLKEIKR